MGRMLLCAGTVFFLLLATADGENNPNPCLCSRLLYSQLRMDCSSKNLVEMPYISPDATEVLLQDNRLTTVPPGHLDMPRSLKMVNLSRNPFHCGCGIQYLWMWLHANKEVTVVATCASPGALAGRAISTLSHSDFFFCSMDYQCFGGPYEVFLGCMFCLLIVLLMWNLRLAKNSTFILGIDERHAGFEAESLRSMKPKHRKRIRSIENSNSIFVSSELEQPLLGNMEILPQIIEVLHQTHNIKIKAT
ncbi:platelet glycoprotein IX isoform X1 [Denticeps clupeoides]|uniref:platelet glycoprotein IX isoform X1 n=1 Tax=Denticeps clupeoides TaxID=299321 RepID=UPI0010A33533|nr:platelet glycoprotein IX-like isoform X1 [Denticeps clupeoides]